MIQSPDVEFIMEAHNGLSAKIVQEAGKYLTFFVNQEVTHLRYFLNILNSTLSISGFLFLGNYEEARKESPPLSLSLCPSLQGGPDTQVT